jgi:hypothetical protein
MWFLNLFFTFLYCFVPIGYGDPNAICMFPLKMTLLKLHREDQLKVTGQGYRFGPAAAYKRAWQIVNDVVGYKPFIDEFKAFRRMN